jgi:hypothetical protein
MTTVCSFPLICSVHQRKRTDSRESKINYLPTLREEDIINFLTPKLLFEVFSLEVLEQTLENVQDVLKIMN